LEGFFTATAAIVAVFGVEGAVEKRAFLCHPERCEESLLTPALIEVQIRVKIENFRIEREFLFPAPRDSE